MNTGKLKLSPYYWANFWFFIALFLAVEAGLLWMYHNWELSEEDLLWIPTVFMPAAALARLHSALNPWRFLMTMEVGDGVLRSFLFGQLWCEVFIDLPVYYAFLEFDEHSSISKPYIAISNHPFKIRARNTSFIPLRTNRFIDYYDRKTVILFPRDPQTEALFPIDKWHQIGNL